MDPPAVWPRLPGTPRPEQAEAPVSSLSGVGPALEKRLAKLGLRRVRDLLEHRPHRYEAAVPERRIADLLAEEEAAIAGEVRSVSVRRPRRNLAIVNARVGDDSGEIVAVWFNQAWLEEKLQPGTRVRLRGQLKRNGFQVRSYDLNGVAATAASRPARALASPTWSTSSSSNASRLRPVSPSSSERGRCSAQSASARNGSPSAAFNSAGKGSGRSRAMGSARSTSPRSRGGVTSSLAG